MIVLLDKPTGITSQTAVSKVKRLLGIKKIGHTGTLDPLASGLLPLLTGSSTTLSDLLTNGDKRYTAGVLLGQATDTLDITGTILEQRPVNLTEADFKAACAAFVGEITQIPPMYSAIKKDGVRLYDLARKGIEIEREGRQVTLYSIDVLHFEGTHALIDVHCSKGTYIRTLIEDIGVALGSLACMESLRRTMSAGFSLADSVTLETLEALLVKGEASSVLIPPEHLFIDLPIFTPDDFFFKLLWDGQKVLQKKLQTDIPSAAMTRLYHEDLFVGLLKEFQGKDGSVLGVYWRK